MFKLKLITTGVLTKEKSLQELFQSSIIYNELRKTPLF